MHRFEAELDGKLALLEYQQSGDRIYFTHTEVPEAFEGQGIGGKLVRAAYAFAREKKLDPVARCPFVSAYLEKHPDL